MFLLCLLSQEGSSEPPLSEEDQLSLAIALSLEQATMGKDKVRDEGEGWAGMA